MIDNTKEYICCAAIWYKELPTPAYNCTNISQGLVLCGHRHPHIIQQMKHLTGKRTVTFAEDGVGAHTQGFLTSTNRFVDRREAAKIAIEQGQTLKILGLQILFSEDIY